ncbi:2-C-methyl-D-erythritol 4-phosphate cytidylyltransferase [Ammonifex degensii KC4]|uniref:Bifunctional enzyme IspD/IspF n=1 Tax=Ammonifex degensii (strain DSM 10501 / KC4) TaxID=429009 RepID=C9RBC7_AMMDK|nr:2-C-methyl-D-erythritol 4-phosphate cytidylyltransferase [Ammonifex degensii KC4]
MPLVEAGVVVVAAGQSRRMGEGPKKQFRQLLDLPVFAWSLEVCEKVDLVKEVVLVVPPGEENFCLELVKDRYPKLKAVVPGGEHRQDSVFAGLLHLSPLPVAVVHDGARPLVTPALMEEVIKAAAEWGGAIAAVPVRDTVKRVDAEGRIKETLPREEIYLAQTPQAFRYELLMQAHRRAKEENYYATDDAALVEREGVKVKVVPGSYSNLKITTPEDLELARALVGGNDPGLRIGIGYDVHPLVEGRPLILGGVEIEAPLGLAGHSDADVLCHALMDALLGAMGKEDIGHFFPPSDPAYRGARSLDLLARVCTWVKEAGFRVVNVDAVVLAERPRLAPYLPAIKANFARVLGIPESRVGIKATTTEGLGFVGREEGMAAYAVVLLAK